MITYLTAKRALFLGVFALTTLLSVNGYGDESVSSIPPGFHVIDVSQDHATQLVHVTMNISGGDQVIPLIYFSKSGWESSAPTQINVETHPCRTGNDICCLNTFWANYQHDDTVVDLANNAQVCPGGVSNVTTPSQNSPLLGSMTFPGQLIGSEVIAHVDGVDGYSGVTYTTTGTGSNIVVEMTFPLDYLDTDLGGGAHGRVTETAVIGTFEYSFFVGVVFVGLSQSSDDVFIQVMQENVEFTRSEFLFFSVTTEQSRTPIDSMSAFVHQGKSDQGYFTHKKQPTLLVP